MGPKEDSNRNGGEIAMKLKVKRASNSNLEEWDIETLSDLFEKAREHGDIIVHNPDDVSEWRGYEITIYDDYLE